VIGQLVRGLQARMARRAGGLTVLSCDNLPGNGALVRSLVMDFCARLDRREGRPLAEWIEERVSFPSTVADRIVPAATPADRDLASRLLGIADRAAVSTEPYRQWVIEDRFAGPRPAWERAGALLVADVRPYEIMKLRLVNAPHSALAYLGALCGYRTVAAAMADAGLGRAVELLMSELLATVGEVPGFRPRDHAARIRRRFADAGIAHRLAQIAEDGSHKVPPRLLAPAGELLAAGRPPRWTCLAVAAWLRYLWVAADPAAGPRDPMGPRLAEMITRARDPAAVVDGLLRIDEIVPPELAAAREFRELTVDWLERLVRDGAPATVRTL
jgi:fructuronate reductase